VDNQGSTTVRIRGNTAITGSGQPLYVVDGTSQTAPALALVYSLRTIRGASPFTILTPENLLDERGREFFWEGVRRQDLIRFGQNLTPTQEKKVDDPKYLLPIPNKQLTNPNLIQNPGY
jgi:hypothetical protein